MDVSVIFSDRNLVICVKPAGILSESGGMPELLKEKLGGEIYPVHRLDRAVGGLMVYARDRVSAGKLSALAAGPGLKKHYLAAVSGCPEQEKGIYRDLLFKDSSKNKSYVVKRMRKGVKEAELEYELLESTEGMSLLGIGLHTGRSHQIRVQLASRAMPIIGDVKYGSIYKDCGIALWSHRLSFTHPFSKKPMDFSVKPPEIYPWLKFNHIKEEN